MIAFSPDGKYVAIYGNKAISILDANGKYLRQITANTRNVAESIDFSPDSKMLVVRQPNSLQLYKIRINSNGVDFVVRHEELFFVPLILQKFKISPDSKSILVSCQSGIQQVVQLYLYNSEKYKYQLFSQFKCPWSSQTSAVFSKDGSGVLSSSDKIRLWKIPGKESEPIKTLDTKSEFISSIEYEGKNDLYNAYAYNNNLLKYNSDGDLIAYDSSGTASQTASARLRLVAFLPNEHVLIVSEDGKLKMYNKKATGDAFHKDFHFEQFTNEQLKKYGLYKNE